MFTIVIVFTPTHIFAFTISLVSFTYDSLKSLLILSVTRGEFLDTFFFQINSRYGTSVCMVVTMNGIPDPTTQSAEMCYSSASARFTGPVWVRCLWLEQFAEASAGLVAGPSCPEDRGMVKPMNYAAYAYGRSTLRENVKLLQL
jgi:hypothetical protein